MLSRIIISFALCSTFFATNFSFNYINTFTFNNFIPFFSAFLKINSFNSNSAFQGYNFHSFNIMLLLALISFSVYSAFYYSNSSFDLISAFKIPKSSFGSFSAICDFKVSFNSHSTSQSLISFSLYSAFYARNFILPL